MGKLLVGKHNKLKSEFLDFKLNLFSFFKVKLISVFAGIFLKISNKTLAEVVVLPSSEMMQVLHPFLSSSFPPPPPSTPPSFSPLLQGEGDLIICHFPPPDSFVSILFPVTTLVVAPEKREKLKEGELHLTVSPQWQFVRSSSSPSAHWQQLLEIWK